MADAMVGYLLRRVVYDSSSPEVTFFSAKRYGCDRRGSSISHMPCKARLVVGKHACAVIAAMCVGFTVYLRHGIGGSFEARTLDLNLPPKPSYNTE